MYARTILAILSLQGLCHDRLAVGQLYGCSQRTHHGHGLVLQSQMTLEPHLDRAARRGSRLYRPAGADPPDAGGIRPPASLHRGSL